MKRIFLLLIISVVAISSCSTARNQSSTNPGPELINLMQQSAKDWNNADLEAFRSLYDTAATFMFSTGPVGLARMRENYEKGFFKDGKPLQQLRFADLEIRSLGDNHAMLTGKFVLSGNNLAEKKGVYTLVFVRRSTGWKILHDHSS